MTAVLVAYPLLVLATYRVWRLVAVDTITEPIRAWFIFRDGPVWTWMADLVTCAWCLGWWLSGVAAVAYVTVFGVSWWWLVLVWPAVSAGVGLLDTLVDRLSSNG